MLRLCGGERAGSYGYTVNVSFCRPVACTCETGCPWGRTCSNGICQIPSAPLLLDDVLALCTADALWPATCEELASNYSAGFPLQMQAVANRPSRSTARSRPPADSPDDGPYQVGISHCVQ